MRLNKSYYHFQIKLNRFHNLTVSKIDLNRYSGVKLAYKFAKSLTKTSSKIYKLNTDNNAIDNLIQRNR